jgi:hypothetical protein
MIAKHVTRHSVVKKLLQRQEVVGHRNERERERESKIQPI